MSRRRILQIVLAISSVIVIVGVVLMGAVMGSEDDRNVIEVVLDEIEGETNVNFEYLTLVPGESCEYTLSFDAEEANEYDVTLEYYEKEADKGHVLKDYARVRIESGEEILCDELLAAVFDGMTFRFPVNVEAKQNTQIRLVYYLPIDVGNEAQDAEAFFGLKITATNNEEGVLS